MDTLAAESVFDRNPRRSGVGHHHRNQERGDSGLVRICDVNQLFERFEAPDAGRHRYRDPGRVDIEWAGLLQGLMSGNQGEVGESIETSVLSLGARAPDPSWRPIGNRRRWRVLQALPQIVHPDTGCGDDPDAGDHHLSAAHLLNSAVNITPGKPSAAASSFPNPAVVIVCLVLEVLAHLRMGKDQEAFLGQSGHDGVGHLGRLEASGSSIGSSREAVS